MTAMIQTLGIASCLGGPMRLCGYAAEMLRDLLPETGLQLQWHMVFPGHQGTKESRLRHLNGQAAEFTRYWAATGRPFLVVGGDHSCAMGTWGGVLDGLPPDEELGLLWLDAHLDAHTFLTSPSGNIHGMPLAALLGKADARLAAVYPASRFIKPENLVLLGARSYEAEEYALLHGAGVEIVFAGQIADFTQTLLAALQRLGQRCARVGISLDLDLLDPADAPGVETPVPGGISAAAVLAALAAVSGGPKLCGLEISEFNPENDHDGRTLRLMRALAAAFYLGNSPNKSLGSAGSGNNANSVPS